MVDSLPLIPNKGGACGDARPVLRDVFCELPPLAPLPAATPAHLGSPAGQWCGALRRREEHLRRERAQRLARPQPRNKFSQRPPMYRCYPPCKQPCESPPCLGTCALTGPGPIRRGDLMPGIDQLATRDTSMWVGNTLAGDENASLMAVRKLSPCSPKFEPTELLVTNQCQTETSVSYCEAPEVWVPPQLPPPPLIISQSPAFVACIPERIEFVDFTVGQLHLFNLRVVNISRVAVRLSLILPAHRELNVELTGARGLTVTSGAATDLRIHFVPLDVRPLQDELIVRVSEGCNVAVPVSCYVRPPILHVQVPALMQVVGSSSRNSIEASDSARPGDLLDLGARLLGAVHVSRVIFRCCNNRVNFFLMTEEDWHGHAMSSVTESGALWTGDEDTWGVWPVAWRGGGVTSGTVCCVSQGPGLRTTALRVVSSTAIARPLTLLADSVIYHPDHVTIQAQPQDYDILSAEDRQCQCYVHLGTVHPGRLIRGTVLLINNSPIEYHYYWKVRPWGVCSCWEEERARGKDDADNDDLCEGAAEARAQEGVLSEAQIAANAVKVEAVQGVLAARASCTVHIIVPNVGHTLGTQRAALVLVLCDVPEKSFPSDWVPDVIRRRQAPPPLAPGLHLPQIDTCDVVCAQLEVWWHVAPLRFMLDPPVISLPYSRRVHALELLIRATQLYSGQGARAVWRLPADSQAPPPLALAPAYSSAAALRLPLIASPDERSVSEVLSLEAEGGEWVAKCVVNRTAYTRHPKLRPTLRWLGHVAPGARLATAMTVTNDTHTSAWWAAHAWRWLGERPVGPACVGRVPCGTCQQRTCTCHMLHPTRAHHLPGDEHHLHYEVTAPDRDGCVATLVSLVRAMADQRVDNPGEGTLAGSIACEGRATLVTYRVIAPRLVLRVYPCGGVTGEVPECRPCTLDSSDGRVLRPTGTLTLGRRTCYRLRLTNVTPLPTRVRWLAPPNGEEDLKIIFIPNDYDVGSYANVEIKVVVEAMRVCKRRVWVRSAYVDRAFSPIYLLVDVAVSGMEVELEWPLGGDEKADSFALVRRTQRPGDDADRRIIAPEKAFAEEDIRSAYVRRKICYCRCQNVYIEPEKPPPRDPDVVPTTIGIVTEPPSLTRVCACFDAGGVPWRTTAHGQPACIQLWNMPVRKVVQRVLVLRNTSTLTARWSASVRLWPRKKVRAPAVDPWVAGVGSCGVAIHLCPSSGVLGANARIEIQLSAYADTWGVYRDEVLFQVEYLAPLIVTIWLHAVGPPLELALRGHSPPLPSTSCRDVSAEPTMWISPSDKERIARARNTSRADVLVRAYVVTNYERPSQALPFRLYYRLIDIPPRECECTRPHHYCVEDEEEVEEEVEPGTGFELYLGDDYGAQSCGYRVIPEVQTVLAGHAAEWHVVPPSEPRVASTLIMRPSALMIADNDWRRTEPATVWLRLQIAEREGRLCVLRDELRIEVSALSLPYGEVVRVRKRVAVQNSGNGWLTVLVRTGEPWSVVEGAGHGQCSARCGPRTPGHRRQEMTMKFAPRSTTALCVEVRVPANAAWPSPPQPKFPSFLNPISSVTAPTMPATAPSYPEWREYCDKLIFYDNDDTTVLYELPLILWLELPRISVVPPMLDFGYVWDGETRKSYCEVSHTSRRETLCLHVMWDGDGDEDFTVRPSYLRIPPGEKERVTVRYRARWKPSPAEGTVLIRARSDGAAWCCVRLPVRAAPSRDYKCRLPPHDYTIDTALLPQ